ncbi:MAG: UDP-2,4-diacetamido-2,4,6-trideoxy-beta-L-altropyranose hydrolase [Candidatus Aquicultor sp.]
MNIVVRVDASTDIGSGHVMRCLVLADGLRQLGRNVSFVSRDLPGNLCHVIENKGYSVYHLPYNATQNIDCAEQPFHARWLGVDWEVDAQQTVDCLGSLEQPIEWLIIDHYALDHRWESYVQPYIEHIMIIDDLADRLHKCDLLLDQNLYENPERRYKNLVPYHCEQLLGPQYVLMRPEFHQIRQNLGQRDGKVNRILVFFGGSDLTNETSKALEAIRMLSRADIKVDVVIGVNNPHKALTEEIANNMSYVICYSYVDNMAELMANADMYIGAAGITTWERFCLGLPSLVVTVAENQVQPIKELAKRDLLFYIGEHDKVKAGNIKQSIDFFISNPAILKLYSKASMNLVDGLGVKRCVQAILKHLPN